ncbi:hypothetical protein EHM92_00810 [bacterium]|nr:MAG: hypothetical protein EHM92_00810 [bacterium]
MNIKNVSAALATKTSAHASRIACRSGLPGELPAEKVTHAAPPIQTRYQKLMAAFGATDGDWVR